MTELQIGRWVARMKSGKQIEQGSCALQKNSSFAQRSCAVALGRQKKKLGKENNTGPEIQAEGSCAT
jgi:hypothetical protein